MDDMCIVLWTSVDGESRICPCSHPNLSPTLTFLPFGEGIEVIGMVMVIVMIINQRMYFSALLFVSSW